MQVEVQWNGQSGWQPQMVVINALEGRDVINTWRSHGNTLPMRVVNYVCGIPVIEYMDEFPCQ